MNIGDVDQTIQPAAVYGPINAAGKAADRFANAVISWRTTQPFISTSQLSQLTATDKNNTASQPFFGNLNQYVNNDGPTAQSDGSYWNDAATEEYFAKLYNLTTVRSRNFRVFVTGQVYIPANGSNPSASSPRPIRSITFFSSPLETRMARSRHKTARSRTQPMCIDIRVTRVSSKTRSATGSNLAMTLRRFLS